MPEIQEYTQQIAAPESFGSISPNIELAGAVGKSIEGLGNKLGQAADLAYRRDAQAETADVYAHFADQRSYWTNKLDQQTQDGSLDINKFVEEYDNSSGTVGDNLETSEGRNFFERQQARLRGNLLQKATHAKAQVASNEAQGQWAEAMNKTGAVLETDPSQFHDVYEQGLESIDQMIKTGGLPEALRSKAELAMGKSFSMASIRGWAEVSPEAARHMLKEGAYDQFLSTNDKHAMEGEINSAANRKEVEANRGKKAVEDAQKLASENWGAENLEKLGKNALSTKDVYAAVRDKTLTWEQGERWVKMIDEGTRKERTPNVRLGNDLGMRIVNPNSSNPINSIEELGAFVKPGGITTEQYTKLASMFNRSPEQQAAAQGEKALFDSAKKTIRFKNMETNQYDVLGEQKLAQFMSDYVEAKKQIKTNGGNIADLGNPNSPFYFGNRLESYTTNMQDQMNHVAQGQTSKALGLNQVPGGPPPKPVQGAKLPNESAAAYLKRMGK